MIDVNAAVSSFAVFDVEEEQEGEGENCGKYGDDDSDSGHE